MREPVSKSDGSTSAERYLKKLCDRTFLSLWSYPNLYRDQGNLKGGVGKELADLLVVFENHVIIFSDKDCMFPDSGNLDNDWKRWFRRAVTNSAKQAWGAERWIKSYPDRLFLDRACKQPFPYELPYSGEMRFHLLVVGHDAARKCKEVLGGSGSFMIRSDVVGVENHTAPFTVGDLDPTKSFVHILDDTSLDILMLARNTISDFVDYLTKKEDFVRRGKPFFAAGEEELLAHFLKNVNHKEEHDFIVPNDTHAIGLLEGIWEEFETNPQRIAQLKADEVSYVWDQLIEQFSGHALQGTQHFTTPGGVADAERILRFLAREPRVRRRMLSRALLGIVQTAPSDQMMKRYVLPSYPGDPFYIFLLLPENTNISYEEYRKRRRALLEMHCLVVKFRNSEAMDIIGIATEPNNDSGGRSEDAMYFNARTWTAEDQQLASEIVGRLGMSPTQPDPNFSTESEYPEVPGYEESAKSAVQKNPRNKPCTCGSGKKYKKCHGAS